MSNIAYLATIIAASTWRNNLLRSKIVVPAAETACDRDHSVKVT